MSVFNNKISDIILKNILTPVIYMIEYDDTFEFFCFCDRGILMNEIYRTQSILQELLGKNVIILDIRELPEAERIETLKSGELIYYEDEVIKQIFEVSMLEDFKLFIERRDSAIERIKMSGTAYLS